MNVKYGSYVPQQQNIFSSQFQSHLVLKHKTK